MLIFIYKFKKHYVIMNILYFTDTNLRTKTKVWNFGVLAFLNNPGYAQQVFESLNPKIPLRIMLHTIPASSHLSKSELEQKLLDVFKNAHFEQVCIQDLRTTAKKNKGIVVYAVLILSWGLSVWIWNFFLIPLKAKNKLSKLQLNQFAMQLEGSQKNQTKKQQLSQKNQQNNGQSIQGIQTFLQLPMIIEKARFNAHEINLVAYVMPEQSSDFFKQLDGVLAQYPALNASTQELNSDVFRIALRCAVKDNP